MMRKGVSMASDAHKPPPGFQFNPAKDIPLAIFSGQMWWYAFNVLYPAQALKSTGWYPKNELGRFPASVPESGEGQLYCREYLTPSYLPNTPEAYDLVADFDRTATEYETYVRPFTRPVYEETDKVMRQFLARNSRILDASCGPGVETLQLAALVPDGEVIAMDLSAGMVATAFERARRQGMRNTAFFQADVVHMPEHFADRFDAVYCSFAFHHYPDPLGALKEMYRALNSQGKAFVVDPGSWWFNMISAPFAKWADSGWVGFHTGEEFQLLFQQAGFSDFYWTEVLPGIGLCIGSK
jgi:ubiquinone/menaquinone biosynthesis C-methylase UbiE